MTRGAEVTPAGELESRVCGRGGCDRPAVVVRRWRSDSGRGWRTTACEVHEVERDPAALLPGFTFEDERRLEARDGAQTPSQVG